MQQSEDIEVKELEEDQQLYRLFYNQENPLLQRDSIPFEAPEKFDRNDLQKDYNSECFSASIKKKRKKSKPIINVALRDKRKNKQKLYIQMLQNRIFQMQKQIDYLRRQTCMQKQQLRKSQDSEQTVSAFFKNRQKHYEKLVGYAQRGADDTKFTEQYNGLRLIQGAMGKQRIKTINYYFRQLSEMLVPDLQKYTIKTARQQEDLFDPNLLNTETVNTQVEEWRKEIIIDLQLSKQKILTLHELRGDIISQSQNLEQSFEIFYQTKKNITENARKIQIIYDRMNCLLTPKQIAKCLCLLEKYRFEKGFSVMDLFKSTFNQLFTQEKEIYDPNDLYRESNSWKANKQNILINR